jgi:hypothetical protein
MYNRLSPMTMMTIILDKFQFLYCKFLNLMLIELINFM